MCASFFSLTSPLLSPTTEITYTSCIRHEDCDFRTLSVRFPVARFTFSCCQSALCNEAKKKKGALRTFLDMFG